MDLRSTIRASRGTRDGANAYLASAADPRLQLGAGTNIFPGWFNTDAAPASTDVFFLDSTRTFPFDDGVLSCVYSEHHLEHLSLPGGLATLRECHRVLRVGGTIRIATPDLNAIVRLLDEELTTEQQRYVDFIAERYLHPDMPRSVAAVVNNAFHNWGHQFLYDHNTLADSLARAGFVDVRRVALQESNHPLLRKLEQHGDFVGDQGINHYETMVVEATRGAGRASASH